MTDPMPDPMSAWEAAPDPRAGLVMPKVGVIGAGAWGTTLAVTVGREEPALLVGHSPETVDKLAKERRDSTRLPGVQIPETVAITTNHADLASATDLVIVAVPSAHVREAMQKAAPFIPESADVLSVVKGLENGTLFRMSEVIAQAGGIDPKRIAALSGPNLALEIARALPASAVVGSADPALGERIVARLGRRHFRLYTNSDLLGVELAGALKNIIAIAAGAADGLGFGDNGKAGLITRGLAEITRLGIAVGANPLTFAGLAGIGDVVATCGSKLSRNHRLGDYLAQGRTWKDVQGALGGVAEGAYTVDAALALAARHGVDMPIAQEVHNVLFEGKSVPRALIDLLSRESKDELADFERWATQVRGSQPG
jgi:glycerol-3-phosphate dehydrogenase (NAD(P)+)